MKFRLRQLLLLTAAILLFFTLVSAAWYFSRYTAPAHNTSQAGSAVADKIVERLKEKAASIASYAMNKKFNTEVCFLVNMNIASGKNRFYVYNLEKDSVMYAGLVTHGRCNESWLTGRKYDNKVGCGCTSLGKYKIGTAYQGRFGLAYKLHGLDATNNNAYRRYVVLHSHECVPEKEPDPYPICQSDGCPTVSPGFLKVLAGIIDNSNKPVLLCIYDED